MKKLLFSTLFLTVFLTLSISSVSAQNKAGINIGANHSDMQKAADIVGPGGWVVMMACPGDGDKIAKFVQNNPSVNLIIRGHFAGTNPDAKLAKAWAATLSSIPTPNIIYFMPWNEPNQVGENDYGNPTTVSNYITVLKKELGSLIGKKVFLLSPMMNPSNPSFSNYVKDLGPGFFQQFDGIALSLYDLCPSVLNCNSPYQNPLKAQELLTEMGASEKPIFGVESGTANPHWYFNYPPNSSSPLFEFVRRFLNESNVKMFAIPSYDLAGERGHSWSLFDSPDVINLLKQGRLAGGKTTPASLGSITPSGVSLCPGKKHTYYVDSASECEECGLGVEPMILEVKDNLICTDFTLSKRIETSQYTPVTPTPQQSQVLPASTSQIAEGSLTLKKETIPDFSLMEQNLYLGLNKLLPQALRRNLSLDSTPLKTRVKHYVVDAKNAETSSPTKIPETEITLPSWWTRILGSTKIACGFFNTCEPPQKMAIKIAANVPEPPSQNTDCSSGNFANSNPVSNIEPVESNFSTPANFIIEILEPVLKRIENVWQLVTTTITTVNLVNKSRGQLPGGETLNEQSTYLNYAIPQNLSPKDEEIPLAGEAEFEVEGYQTGEGANKLNYQQEVTRKRYCLERCALKPQGISIQSFDPLCPKCSF